MPIEPTDESLLARLNALRPSTVSLTSSFKPSTAETSVEADPKPDADLASRFARLKGAGRPDIKRAEPDTVDDDSGAAAYNAEDDQTLDELLQELSASQHDTTVSRTEAEEARNLLQDAKKALEDQQAPVLAENEEHGGEIGGVEQQPAANAPPANNEDAKDGKLTEDQEADEYIQRVLAEVSLEDGAECGTEAADGEQQDHNEATTGEGETAGNAFPSKHGDEDDEGDGDDGIIALPSAPTFTPVSPQADPASENLLPSTPSSAPTSKPTSALKPAGPSHTDEEIDSWCIICLANATLRCLGCDGDLYCDECWAEGHRGESAGYEERRHKAVAFVKGGGLEGKKKARRKLAA